MAECGQIYLGMCNFVYMPEFAWNITCLVSQSSKYAWSLPKQGSEYAWKWLDVPRF